ncbi:MAG: CYTH domain-containing protein [Deltaproteobacteria bacterium]|nr:CYTH domain-containing protein [Deltaproteobacteria bacterium]
MVETELKFRLAGEEELARLEALLGKPLLLRQLSSHYWIPGSPPHASLRLREVDGAAELTVKRGGAPPVDGLHVREEVSERIDAGLAVALLCGEVSPAELPLVHRTGLAAPFHDAGRLLTERRTFRAGILPVETDRVLFPDGSRDWEVEVEAPEAAALRGALLELARRAGVALVPSRDTKLQRLLARQDPAGATP